jgi:beta-lactamase regulating signal transducer with metallopeptidase domain
METASRLVIAFVLNAAWQIPLVALAAAIGARLLPSAAARHRILLAAVGLSLLAPAASLQSRARAGTATLEREAPPAPARAGSAGAWPGWLTDPPRPSIAPAPLVGRVVAALYLASLVVVAHRRARAWRGTTALRRSGLDAPLPDGLRSAAEECAGRLGLGLRDVAIRLSPAVASPATLGARRPLILIPAALAGALEREHLMAALGHEMAHVRRRDFAWNAAAELASWPIAFHPVTAWLRRGLRQSRELACDALVAERVLEPWTYARSLAALARVIVPAPALTLGVADAGILEERVMSLITGRSRRRAGVVASLAASSMLAAASAVGAAFAVAVDSRAAGTAAILGSWSGRIPGTEDVPAADLMIVEKDGKLAGRVTFYVIHQTADGRREIGGKEDVEMLEPGFDGQRLTFKLENPRGETVPMALRLTGDGEGELATQVTVGDRGDRTESRGMVVKMKRAR